MSTNLEAENNNDNGSQPESGAQKDVKGQAKGGKKNKQKGKTMSLAAFNAHAEQQTVANWADHVETVVNTRQSTQPTSAWQPKQSGKYVEPESAYDLDVDPIRSQLPTAPRAAREAPVVDLSRIPEDGPFKVHVGNLPFDVTEQAVASFFGAQEKQVNLIREGGRPKGFGFVELATRELLIEALGKNGESMRGRAIKVALATAPAGSENERHRDRDDRPNRSWRNDAPREEVERNWRERRDDRGPERRDDRDRYGDDRERRFDDRDRRYDGGRRFGDRERRFDDGGRRFDDRERRFDDRERRFDDRERRFDDRERRFDDRDRRRFDRERDDEPRAEESNWRRGLAQRKADERDADGPERSGDSEPRREFSPEAGRREREPDRERERDREPERERERDREPEREREAERDRESDQKPRERPKLNLQPRTKPLGEVGVQSGMSEATRKAIFGSAKPVDTVAREREIEQRLDAEREKFEHAHELDEAVANRTRHRTISSSSNTSNRRYEEPPARVDDAPATDRERERLNSVRSNASKLAEEEEHDTQRERSNYRTERADRPERTWYRGGAPRGRIQRPSAQSDRRPPADRAQGDDEYFYDDDYRSERPQPEADDETPTYYGSAAHRQAPPRGAGRWVSRPGRPARASHDAPDEDGFQQVGAGGRAVPGGSATHRPADYPGGKPTSGTAAPKRPEIVKKDKEEAPLQPAALIHKSKFSALDEDAPDEE